jgi:hypothetical protein
MYIVVTAMSERQMPCFEKCLNIQLYHHEEGAPYPAIATDDPDNFNTLLVRRVFTTRATPHSDPSGILDSTSTHKWQFQCYK